MRYRKSLPLVLKDITFNVKDQEKIGIVGRTGSGKSSMFLALARLVEPEDNKDTQIVIDGENILNLNLKFYRKRISVIPQHPYLYKGTLRENIDPFNNYSDEQVIKALKKALLWDSTLFEITNKDNTVHILTD